MTVHLQQNPSVLETGSQLTSLRKNGTTRQDIPLSAYDKAIMDLSHDKKLERDLAVGRQIGFYRIRGELGSGNFSQVKLGVHILTRDKVAVKILDKTKLDAKTQRLLSREITSMERLHHPNVVRLYEVIETLSKLHLVMEYASCGELFTKISNDGRLHESEAKPLFAQIVAAVEHMHQKGIIHRDLKAENVLFANLRSIKVADFGFSTPVDGSDGYSAEFGPAAALTTFCGSPPYAAPELFCDDNYYGVFVDIWALGILLYFMVVGVLPFRADTVGKLKKCILGGLYTIPSFLSDSCRSLVGDILHRVPTSRLTIDEMRSSAWLEGQDFPSAMEPFRSDLGSCSSLEASDDQRITLRELADLGISTDLLTNSDNVEARSNIVGTYRIVMHRIQKRRFDVDLPPSLSVSIDETARMQNGFMSRPVPQSTEKKLSKVCTIL